MAAAQPIGDYRLDLYLSSPFQYETTADPLPCFSMAPALGDPEDPFPTATTRDRAAMPNDDSRNAVTTPAPDTEPRARDTQPPGEADEEARRAYKTMLPKQAPLSLEDSYLDRAIRVVAEAGAKLAVDREERRHQHEAVLAAIIKADGNASRNYELLRTDIRQLKQNDAAQDGKIADIRIELAALREQVERQAKDLAQAVDRMIELEKRIPNATAQGPTPSR